MIKKLNTALNIKLQNVSAYSFTNEVRHIESISPLVTFSFRQKDRIARKSAALIDKIKENNSFSMEQFFNKYNLTTQEGKALVGLAECLIRIPDNHTAIDLVKDKLAGKNWKQYIDLPQIKVIEFASIGLYISGQIANVFNNIKTNILSKASEPIFTASLKYAISVIGKEFIIGEYIDEAIEKAKTSKNLRYSFDLLGEASRTFEQAEIYYNRYVIAINKIAQHFPYDPSIPLKDRPNLSIKLTALYPRLELLHLDKIKQHLVPKLLSMVVKMAENGISVSFDAEESYRLDIYLEVVTAIISDPKLSGFEGVGFVVQAYQKRALKVLEYIVDLSIHLNKKIPVRLVKGAYWDTEIKHAQTHSLSDYTVFTQKEYTDANYIACAKYMLSQAQYIFAQFATHNAITVATIEELAGNIDFEFQKLYGMGDTLHKELLNTHNIRVYAPVGITHDLLAYLMRRMLENGANSSFVHMVNKMSTKHLVSAVYSNEIWVNNLHTKQHKTLPLPYKIYKNRETAIGFDLGDKMHIKSLTTNIEKFKNNIYNVGAIIDGKEILNARKAIDHFRPGNYAEKIGSASYIGEIELNQAMEVCHNYWPTWNSICVSERAKILHTIADLFHKHEFEILSILIRESGKSIKDAIAEIHEAIDFCKYYAIQAELIMQDKILPGVTGEQNTLSLEGRGAFLCISPWNFPLAIFTGQIVAALVTGNTVVAKAADQTPIIANYVVKLMHQSGIPQKALQLVIASGNTIGQHLTSHQALAGIVFTGSTATAHKINLTLAQNGRAIIPFIAETGGQNAMIVDSSALLEQVTDDVIASAFHSAGQRCSALRILYIQDEIYEPLKRMLIGAIDTLKIGDTVDFANDIGPVIDKSAMDNLIAHIEDMKERKFHILTKHSHNGMAKDGYYFYPHIIEVHKISDIPGEKFGPILHIVKYSSKDLDKVIDEINDCGFGLTFGIHSRIEERIDYIKNRIRVGNIYANRSIIGAQVESQPFGGRGLSGTGFKAGGPHYLLRFITEKTTSINLTAIGGNIDLLG